jgi:hypothetical protein
MSTIPAAKCTSRPDCPCDFCVRSREEFAAGRTEGQQLDQLALEWIRAFSMQEIERISPEWVAAGEWNCDRRMDFEAFGTPLPANYPRALPERYL